LEKSPITQTQFPSPGTGAQEALGAELSSQEEELALRNTQEMQNQERLESGERVYKVTVDEEIQNLGADDNMLVEVTVPMEGDDKTQRIDQNETSMDIDSGGIESLFGMTS
jgi:hypothetical protein